MIVEIEEILPGAVYQGETFTQTVIVQLQNGTRLRIEDPTMRCSTEQIGSEVEISISADIAESVKVKDNDTVELEPVDPEKGSGIKRLETVIQEIIEVNETQTTVLLALPTDELIFTFNSVRPPDNLLEDYEPTVGTSLQFEGVSYVMLDAISGASE